MTFVRVPNGKYYLLETKQASGPASYTTGGFTITLDGIREIKEAVVSIDDANNLYRVSYSHTGNTITVKVYQLGFDAGTSTLTISEVAAGTDLSALTFTVIAVGE